MISNGAILVAEPLRGDHHLLEWTTAVGPRGVAVKIAFDRGTQVQAAVGKRLLFVPQLLQILRHLAAHGLGDHSRGFRSDARNLRPRTLLLMFSALRFGEL